MVIAPVSGVRAMPVKAATVAEKVRRFPVDYARHPQALVTGGAGFLGALLCEQLLARGLHVTCLDNFVTSNRMRIAHLTGHHHFRLIEHDIAQPTSVPGDFSLVFHLASPASPRDYARLPVQTLLAGSTGTYHALELARDRGARFVLASSSEVYGDPREHPQAESYRGHVNPVGPRSPYDEAKRYAEALTTAYRHAFRLNTGIARIFNSYGPGMRIDDGRAIPALICQALRGEPLTITGDGTQTRSFCYAHDTVTGLLALADSRHPGPVNIGSSFELSIGDLAVMVKDLTGSLSPIRFISRPEEDPMKRRPDVTLAKKLLGWEARVGLQEGLKHTIGWFASQLDSTADPADSTAATSSDLV